MQTTEEKRVGLFSQLEAELIKKTKDVVSTLGKENLLDYEGKTFKLNCEDGFNIFYNIDWGGRQYLSVSQYDKTGQNILFIVSNINKKDNPLESEVKVEEWDIISYPDLLFNWQQRINDMHYAIETLKKKYSVKNHPLK